MENIKTTIKSFFKFFLPGTTERLLGKATRQRFSFAAFQKSAKIGVNLRMLIISVFQPFGMGWCRRPRALPLGWYESPHFGWKIGGKGI